LKSLLLAPTETLAAVLIGFQSKKTVPTELFIPDSVLSAPVKISGLVSIAGAIRVSEKYSQAPRAITSLSK